MTIISFLVMIYVIALSVLIGAFYWYGTRPDSGMPVTKDTEINPKL